MKSLTAIIAVTMLLCLTSCYTIYLDGNELQKPAQLNSAGSPEFTVVKEFKIKDKAGWIYFFPVNRPAGDRQQYFAELIRGEIEEAGGDAAIDVTVKVQNDFVDYLLTLTMGLYNTRSVIVEGKVIKYN